MKDSKTNGFCIRRRSKQHCHKTANKHHWSTEKMRWEYFRVDKPDWEKEVVCGNARTRIFRTKWSSSKTLTEGSLKNTEFTFKFIYMAFICISNRRRYHWQAAFEPFGVAEFCFTNFCRHTSYWLVCRMTTKWWYTITCVQWEHSRHRYFKCQNTDSDILEIPSPFISTLMVTFFLEWRRTGVYRFELGPKNI